MSTCSYLLRICLVNGLCFQDAAGDDEKLKSCCSKLQMTVMKPFVSIAQPGSAFLRDGCSGLAAFMHSSYGFCNHGNEGGCPFD
uniref:Uncharacterized protein n=1 Tax=Nelumbo nucifera TaxID=4432 RepID=A0A822YCJ3_NELNU|nr:TPA_asm: hypothetical protein HUJ06_031655 [Nelumbo nucifera]